MNTMMGISAVRKQLPLLGLVSVLVILVILALTQFNKEAVDFAPSAFSKGECNIGVVSIDGYLSTDRAENTLDSLTIAREIRALTQEDNEAILLLVDSRGGSAPAAEEITEALDEITMPNATFVRGFALSGGYWIAASTDYIVALSTATVGNIGVTVSYLEETELNRKEGYTFREINSGEFKEVRNENKALTLKHRQYLQDYVDELFELFAEVVKKNRNLSDEQFALVADGKFYTSKNALALSLIDEIGGIAEVKAYFADQLEVEVDKLLLCEPIQFQR